MFKGVGFLIVLVGISFHLLAQEKATGSASIRSQHVIDNFIENINAARTVDEARHVLDHTIFEEAGKFGQSLALSRNFSAHQLRSLSPLAAEVILNDVYYLDAKKIQTIIESKGFNSKWRRWKPTAIFVGGNITFMVIIAGASLLAFPDRPPYIPLLLSLTVPAGSLFGFGPWYWPLRTMGKNISQEIGIEINPYDLKPVRALVTTCAKSIRAMKQTQ